jgi:hypothetical protein
VITIFINKVLEFIEKIATKKFWPIILFFIFLFIIIINGVSLVPYPKYQIISLDPFIKRQETILLPLLGYITKLNSPVNFTGLCFFIILSGYFSFVFFSRKQYGAYLTLLLSSILFTNPITTILLSWVGMPDGLTFLFTIPFLFFNSPLVFFILAFLGTTNHFAFLFAAMEILILRLFSREKTRIVQLVSTIMGGALGLFTVKLFASGGFSRYGFVVSRSLSSWIDHNTSALPLTLFSFFNIQWLILIGCFILYFKKDKIYFSIVLLLLIINYGICFFTLDTTRIFSLLSWGLFIHCVYHSYQLSQKFDAPSKKKLFQLILIIIIFLSFVSPRFFSWEGSIHLSPFYNSIVNLAKF